MDDITSGPLRMELDTGLVTLITEDGDSESMGFIGDEDACPDGLWQDWEYLLDRWNDAGRAAVGYMAAASFSYYDRLAPSRN